MQNPFYYGLHIEHLLQGRYFWIIFRELLKTGQLFRYINSSLMRNTVVKLNYYDKINTLKFLEINTTNKE